jgi:hypothetical protein
MIKQWRIVTDSAYQEQVFLITIFVLSIVASFLFGYMVFRYEKLEMCRTGIEVLPEINPGAKP